MGIPLYLYLLLLPCCCSIFSLALNFVHLINMCLSMLDLGLSCIGLFALPGLESVSFPMLGKFLMIFYSNMFSGPLPPTPTSGTPIMQILLCLIFSQRSLRLSFFHSFFSLFCSTAVISTILSSRWLIRSLASFTLMLIPSSIFFYFRDCIVHLLLFVL